MVKFKFLTTSGAVTLHDSNPSMVESVKRAFEREKLIEERSQRPALVRVLEDPFGGHVPPGLPGSAGG
jgi:hypothetical protein